LLNKIKTRFFGRSYLWHEIRDSWEKSLPIYLVWCNKHGYFKDYPHGHNNYFTCPDCRKELKAGGSVWGDEIEVYDSN